MNIPVKKLIKNKIEEITKNQVEIYRQTHELIMPAFHACMARDVIKDYRYQRESKTRSYNIINSFSHVALENYALLQLWKLFDKENSDVHVYWAMEHMPHQSLKDWFDIEINKIKQDINYLSAWRHNFVGHRTEIAHFAPEEFEKKFKGFRGSEDRIKSFLLFFLCRMKFEMQQIEVHKTMEELSLQLKGFAEFLHKEKEDVLKQYE